MLRILIALLPLSGCLHSRGLAPGPELPQLTQEAQGTLIQYSPTLPGFPEVLLIDLPSLREHEFSLLYRSVAANGVNERGWFVYARDPRLDGAVLDVLMLGYDAPPPTRDFRVQMVDLVASTEREVAVVDGFPNVLELAPRGSLLVVVGAGDPTLVRAIDVTTGESLDVQHGIGEVARCDWLPDGSAFALSGTRGGALIDAQDLTCLERRPEAYGPFAPDGGTYLSLSDEGMALLALDGSREPWEVPALPWARASESADPLDNAHHGLIGMCGPRHAMYIAHPTAGQRVEWEGEMGQPWVLHEKHAIKVVDLESGAYATVQRAVKGSARPHWSPIRLDLLRGS